MKKFALFAMLLGSTFMFGCNNEPPKKGGGTPPPAGATEGGDKKTPDATPAAGEGEKDKGTTPAPTEPAK